MFKSKFYAIIKNGQLIQRDPELFGQHLAKFEEGQEVEMTLEKKYKRRSSGLPGEAANFNGYYWAVIVRMIADEMGEFDQDLVHYWIQLEVGNFKTMRNGARVPKGTNRMSGGEFADYCSRVRMWAATPGNICDKGISIPEPHEVEYE
jgi:hypothetical protein